MGAVVLSINTQHLAVDSFITALNAPNLHVRDTRAALRSAQLNAASKLELLQHIVKF